MAILIVSEKSGVSCGERVFRAILSLVSNEVYRLGDKELAAWLDDEGELHRLVADLDLRDLAPSKAESIRGAIVSLGMCLQKDGRPETRFVVDLAKQLNCELSGEQPTPMNLAGIPPASGECRGPGWPSDN